MLKKIMHFISLLLMTFYYLNGLFVLPAPAGHRIQSRGEGTVSLDARRDDDGDDGDEVPENATGTAKFKIDKKADGVGRLTMTLKVENLPERAQRVYEVWLIDTSGTDLNLTSFNTDNDGNATTKTTRNLVNLTPYDRIIVSTKRADSFETERIGDVVLSGQLHRASDDDLNDDGDFDDDEEFNDDDDFDDDEDNNDLDDDDDNDDNDDDNDNNPHNP